MKENRKAKQSASSPAREFVATVTSKGQVTIPIEVRQQLGLSPQDKVIFRVVEGTRIELEALPMTLEEAYGSVPPLTRPEDFDAVKQIAQEEREARWLKEPKQ
jgi:AbrB family looped-hinge helix DNA binding protein